MILVSTRAGEFHGAFIKILQSKDFRMAQMAHTLVPFWPKMAKALGYDFGF